jgi:FkbM family methyltransferase
MIEIFLNFIEDKTKNYIIFDVGSRDCLQSIEFYNAFPNSKIYAFECNPNTLDICKKNIENYNDRITLIEGAVCDYDGDISFYPINKEKTTTSWEDGNQGASSLFKSNGTYTIENYVQDEIITNCHRLDSIMKKYKIPNVDILWMDLQGAELLAIKSLGIHIQNLKYIYTEVTYKEMYLGQVLFQELNNFILLNNFKIISKLNGSEWQEDIIYENNKHKNYNLINYEDKIYSQNGEDGITIEIINRIMPNLGGFYVEFGVQNGNECNTRILRELYKWNGLLMDNEYENKSINLNKEFITKENIISLFKKYNVPLHFNLLSIDIDFNDFYVLYEILKVYTIDIIILEYNATFPPNEDKVIIYNKNDMWDGSNYFGASLLAYKKLLNKYNYNLIYTDKKGVNAFFVNNKYINKFINVDEINILYNSPKYGNGPNGGHNVDNRNRNFITSDDIILNDINEDDIYDLTKFNYNKYSQRGHDGIIKKIMNELNIKKGFFIEFGAWDGIYLSNCRNLYEEGWDGCFIEANYDKYNILVNNYKESNIICLNKFVYPTDKEGDTLDKLYDEYMNNIDVDLLSIDIDGRDYEILENLKLKPKLIIIEGGFAFHPCLKIKIPYKEASNNIQQPIFTTIKLGEEKGYIPICFNQDLFLLRKDLFVKYNYFKNIKNDCYNLWKSAYYNIIDNDDKNYLNNFRKNNNIINKYEHPYFNNLEHSLNNIFDIVIPVGPNDIEIIEKQLEYTKKNIIGYRNIYLISYDSSIYFEDCITIDENIFPFNIYTVEKNYGKSKRNGWYLQQLLKLYAGIVIKDILDKYLVIDSDTFFLTPTTFIEDNKCLYDYGFEYHKPYFYHMEKLNKMFIKVDNNKSGICHHMIFEIKYIKEIIKIVEDEHKDLFYNVFFKSVDESNFESSGASEYEIYFNYILKNHNENITIRKLKGCNTNILFDSNNSNYDYISYHWYSR